MPDPFQVSKALTDMLPPLGERFTEDYFRSPAYPVKLLHSVASFYCCGMRVSISWARPECREEKELRGICSLTFGSHTFP